MRQITINENDAGQRLDKFLSKRFRTMPKSLMYKYIRTKYIKLNGKKCDKSDFVRAGDVLRRANRKTMSSLKRPTSSTSCTRTKI